MYEFLFDSFINYIHIIHCSWPSSYLLYMASLSCPQVHTASAVKMATGRKKAKPFHRRTHEKKKSLLTRVDKMSALLQTILLAMHLMWKTQENPLVRIKFFRFFIVNSKCVVVPWTDDGVLIYFEMKLTGSLKPLGYYPLTACVFVCQDKRTKGA